MQKQNELRKAAEYLIYLIACALNERKADAKPADVDWKDVYGAARFNSVEGISFFGLDRSAVPAKWWDQWKLAPDLTLYRTLVHDEQRAFIEKKMRAAGFSYIELKGIVLDRYYPRPGMRYMGDNDLLYRGPGRRREAQRTLKTLMEELGYTCVSLERNHDIYAKSEDLLFEMHRELVHQTCSYADYYRHIWDKAVPVNEVAGEFRLSPEDFYIYIIAHTHKHYSSNGSGFRGLIDLFVFLRAEDASLDWTYIQKELSVMGIEAFAAEMKETAFSLFSMKEKPSKKALSMGVAMLQRGTFGTREGWVETGVDRYRNRRFPRLSYLWHKLFPTVNEIELGFPFFYRHRWLIPLLPVYRLLQAVFCSPRRTLQSVKILFRKNK